MAAQISQQFMHAPVTYADALSLFVCSFCGQAYSDRVITEFLPGRRMLSVAFPTLKLARKPESGGFPARLADDASAALPKGKAETIKRVAGMPIIVPGFTAALPNL
jgi:hypothetical protein